jgi:hypothetical protein
MAEPSSSETRTKVEENAKKKEISPLLLTVVGGIITGLVAIYNSYTQAKQAHQLEADKLRSSLILKAIEYPDANERQKALKFYVATGLLSDPDGKIATIKSESIPQAPLSSRQFGAATYSHDADFVIVRSGLLIAVDGAPRAYHPDDRSGLDFLVNAGHPGDWSGIVTEDGSNTGKPIIQGPTDPAPGYFVSATSLEDGSKARTDPRRYVDSAKICYIVLPRGVVGQSGEPKLSDLSTVYYPASGKVGYAVVANIGPRKKLGEGSIALAERLGIPAVDPSGRIGSSSGVRDGVWMVVFPGSSIGWPKTQDEIDRSAANLFETWGGIERLKSEIQRQSHP